MALVRTRRSPPVTVLKIFRELRAFDDCIVEVLAVEMLRGHWVGVRARLRRRVDTVADGD